MGWKRKPVRASAPGLAGVDMPQVHYDVKQITSNGACRFETSKFLLVPMHTAMSIGFADADPTVFSSPLRSHKLVWTEGVA